MYIVGIVERTKNFQLYMYMSNREREKECKKKTQRNDKEKSE